MESDFCNSADRNALAFRAIRSRSRVGTEQPDQAEAVGSEHHPAADLARLPGDSASSRAPS